MGTTTTTTTTTTTMLRSRCRALTSTPPTPFSKSTDWRPARSVCRWRTRPKPLRPRWHGGPYRCWNPPPSVPARPSATPMRATGAPSPRSSSMETSFCGTSAFPTKAAAAPPPPLRRPTAAMRGPHPSSRIWHPSREAPARATGSTASTTRWGTSTTYRRPIRGSRNTRDSTSLPSSPRRTSERWIRGSTPSCWPATAKRSCCPLTSPPTGDESPKSRRISSKTRAPACSTSLSRPETYFPPSERCDRANRISLASN
mmetsp:Transcript_19367/g.44911  ORF Transcript_19367/g.44911 Transcript_19367/m.44911 type:complete len:257 (-) Transcript_19367:1602-2372(-)